MKEKLGDVFIVIIFIITVVVIVGLIIGIGTVIINDIDYGVKEGVIIDKQYEPAYTYTTYTNNYVGNSTIRIPQQNYVSERYRVKIQKEIEGKEKSIWINITKEEYEKYKIGEYYGK